MLKLNKNIEGKNFNLLLDVCFKKSTFFSFTQNGYAENAEFNEHSLFLDELKPFYVKTINTNHWHCYHVPNGYNIVVHLFKTEKNARDIIKKHFDNLYLRDELGNVKKLPEDLCFFIDNNLFIGTVSHEEICNAYINDNNSYKELLPLGEWEEIENLNDEQVVI